MLYLIHVIIILFISTQLPKINVCFDKDNNFWQENRPDCTLNLYEFYLILLIKVFLVYITY